MWTILKEIKKGDYIYAKVVGHPNATPKCSRKCNGEYSRKIQLNQIL